MDKLDAEWTMHIRRGGDAPPPIDGRHPLWATLVADAPLLRAARAATSRRAARACRARRGACARALERGDRARAPRGRHTSAAPTRERRARLERQRQRGLVVSHLHTVRLLCQLLEGLDDATMRRLDVPTAIPLVQRLDAETSGRG